MKKRTAKLSRETKETRVSVEIDLDEGRSGRHAGENRARTTLPFLDHMLDAFATHGRFALEFEASGDTHVDPHHLVEDCGIVLGSAIAKAEAAPRALGEPGAGRIQRAGFSIFPMDKSLAAVALDLCGRPNLVWNVEVGRESVGTMDPALFQDFFKGFSDGLRATLHARVEYKDNDHHALEAVFKALGRALREAVTRVESEKPGGRSGPLSSKGTIDG